MTRLDLSKLSIPDAQLVQRGLYATGHYQGTFLGVPGPKTQAAYDAYWEGNPTTAVVPVTPGTGVPWMREADRWLGLREIAGSKHEPQILNWWEATKQSYRDDETSWCAGFVGGVLEECGIVSTRSAAARSYEKYGDAVASPTYGAIVVFWRGSKSGWQGHVTFLVGVTSSGDLLCLGGNQSDAVTVAKFDRSRLLGFRFPKGDFERRPAPVLAGPSVYSTNEA
jgi:uncharacterized protein (TIGR02594 family)